MTHMIISENKMLFRLEPLKKEDIDEVRQLCDECVGQNLYSEGEIASTLSDEDRFFYLLKNEKGKIIGYIYYYLTDEDSIAEYSKLDKALLHSVCQKTEKKVGKIQSVGLKENYRGCGLATQMIHFVLGKLRAVSVEVVFIVCWKPAGSVPLKKALSGCDFSFLTEAEKVWYDDADLICPYCNGRCRCNAEVYYKILNRRISNET